MVAAGHTHLLQTNSHLGRDAFPAADDRHHAHPGLPGAHLCQEQSVDRGQVGFLQSVTMFHLHIIDGVSSCWADAQDADLVPRSCLAGTRPRSWV